MITSAVISYLSGDFPYATEFQAFLMALQGSMAVRNGANKDGKMAWFHAFMLSVVTGYAGALFTPLFMGRPTTMLASDINMPMCIISFLIVNYVPFGIGHKLGNFFPVLLLITSGAQLFRAMGIIKFVNIAFDAFKDAPSPYYPYVPVFGPILNATMLGNMGGFFGNSFHGYLKNGMPWPFQNGLFCATLYHFIAHDVEGPIGNFMRNAINLVPGIKFGLSDKQFIIVFLSGFMQIMGILQLPSFLGPSFSPFNFISVFFDTSRNQMKGGVNKKKINSSKSSKKKEL